MLNLFYVPPSFSDSEPALMTILQNIATLLVKGVNRVLVLELNGVLMTPFGQLMTEA